MQRRHPIAWDCTTDEVREKIYNGMAEELDWTWKEIERLQKNNQWLAGRLGDEALEVGKLRTLLDELRRLSVEEGIHHFVKRIDFVLYEQTVAEKKS